MINKEPKDRISMHLNIQVGSAHETDEERGLAHFLEHMLFNGSTHFKPGELVKYFQKIGMQFGPDANAHTGFFETVYDILLPAGNRESIDEALLVFNDYAEGALLLESEIDRERQVVLSEKRERDSSAYRTSLATMAFELEGTIFPKRFPIGEEEILKRIDRKKMKEFYDAWYRPEKMILVMVGDFEPDIAESLIRKRFSGFSPRGPKRKEPVIGDISHRGIRTFHYHEQESGGVTASLHVARKIEKRSDSLAVQQKRLISGIGNRIVQNRLNAVIQGLNPPFSSAAIGSGIYLKQIEYAEITSDSPSERWIRSLSTLEQMLRQALVYGFTPEELDRVRKDMLSDMENAVREEATRNSRFLASQLIYHMNNNQVFQSPRQEKELYSPIVATLGVKEVHQAFSETWASSHRLILLTGNARFDDLSQIPGDRIKEVYHRSLETPVYSPKTSEMPRFPYLSETKASGKILMQREIEDLSLLQIDFENGVRLNLKKTDYAANEVLATVSFGFGRSAEPKESPGLALLSEDVVNESGLGGLTKNELDQVLAGKATHVGFRVEESRFVIEGRSISGEIDLLFQLLYAHLIDPAYREESYRLVMDRYEKEYQESAHSIEGAMKLYGTGFLAGYDGRFGFPALDNFKKLTLDHVKSWLDGYFKNAMIEISITGDFDLSTVVERASRYFGSLPARRGVIHPREFEPLSFPTGQILPLEVQTKIPKALAVVAYRTEDLWDIQRTRRLNILGEVASERLREQIREKLGASYSPYAYNRPSRAYAGYGVFFAMAPADPGSVEHIITQIKSILSDIARSGISQDELQRAVKPVKTSIKDMLRRNSYWLDTVLSGSKDHPQQLDWSRQVLDDYASITETEVSALAKRYLNENQAAVILVKPKSMPP
ncbi:MAG: insulinase family protein [Thermodesulfobacteriota bacterium]